jgi:hypothetical protein
MFTVIAAFIKPREVVNVVGLYRYYQQSLKTQSASMIMEHEPGDMNIPMKVCQ